MTRTTYQVDTAAVESGDVIETEDGRRRVTNVSTFVRTTPRRTERTPKVARQVDTVAERDYIPPRDTAVRE